MYNESECCCFQKTDGTWGGLSNMKGIDFPLKINGIVILSNEALYQAMRFPKYPEIQKTILEEKSPMSAKMKSKPYRITHTRADFEDVKTLIMYWCLSVKLAQHPGSFGGLLARTGTKNIVEISHKDKFWGTVRDKTNPSLLIGQNELGNLLMKLRAEALPLIQQGQPLRVEPLGIEDFLLLGNPIPAIQGNSLRKP